MLQRIRREGVLKVSDLASEKHVGGTWWNWCPAQIALEFLYALGELMIAYRDKFQRVYDLTKRVLPKWVDTNSPTVEGRDRCWVERGANALGVCTARQVGDFIMMEKTLACLTHVQMLLPGVDDEWSVKDALAHISTWERWMIRWV